MEWFKKNIFEMVWAGIVIAILYYAMVTDNKETIDKILLVALAIFKGVTIDFNKVDETKEQQYNIK